MGNGRYDRGYEGRDPRSERNHGYSDRGARPLGDREDRGFLERAGEQISSWFGDDETGRGRGGRDDRGVFERRPQSLSDDHLDRGSRAQDDHYHRPAAGRSGQDGSRYAVDDDNYRPMTGDYGRMTAREHAPDRDREMRAERGGARAPSGTTRSSVASGAHDPHYSEWRDRQIGELDRDYDEYRRENQSRFESDFSNWRSSRQVKRQMLGSIREQMNVVGSDEQPVGTVDKVRGDRIILTKEGSADGQHHSISCGMIDRVEGDRVFLDKKADEAKEAMGSELRDRALFERDDDREPGAHILNRSFSGTY